MGAMVPERNQYAVNDHIFIIITVNKYQEDEKTFLGEVLFLVCSQQKHSIQQRKVRLHKCKFICRFIMVMCLVRESQKESSDFKILFFSAV